MTRFGMEKKDFQLLAGLIHEVVMNNGNVVDRVKKLREKFTALKFCFSDSKHDDIIQKLHELL
jgi:aminomethyltransferase